MARAALRVGESILIHGGAGGVGHVAIQLAKAMGARVFTTVREANFGFAQRLGADVVIEAAHFDPAVIARSAFGISSTAAPAGS